MVTCSFKRMDSCRADVNNSVPATVPIGEEDFLDMDMVTVHRDAVHDQQTGTVTPFVKQELKTSIQNRRLQRGVHELVLTDSDTEEEEELSAEEVQKIGRRRYLNKLAAQRCRNKKKDKSDMLTKEIQRLESHNTELRHQIRKLSREKEEITNMLLTHANIFHDGDHLLPQ